MSEFVDAVRQIGIFMVVAQAVTHLAPGEQYEKYVKLIAGIVVLTQFASIFYDISGEEIADRWRNGVAQISEKASLWEDNVWENEDRAKTSYEQTLEGLEQEIKVSLQQTVFPDGYQIKEVRVDVEEETWEFQKLHVWFERKEQEECGKEEEEGQGGSEMVEKIEILINAGDETMVAPNAADKEKRKREFAEIISKRLGIDSECVEVEFDGGL